MKVWVVVGRTESGDDVGPYVFNHLPFEDELKVTIVEDEWDYIYVQTHEVEVIT